MTVTDMNFQMMKLGVATLMFCCITSPSTQPMAARR